MNKNSTIIVLMLFCFTISIQAQLSPHDAIKAMGRGINMGNTLEPPNGEGTWGNPAVVASNFDDYKTAGFTCVRLPITWDNHMAKTTPYQIDAAWLDRIDQIVDWGLSRKLMIIINAHHDGWIKDSYTAENVARFDTMWSQIATRFKNKSDSLLFEVINEPYPMTLAHINELNARTIQTIRKTNPTRIVLFSGNQWSNSQELVVATVPPDSFLIGYYHSYDPWPFGLDGPGTYGSDADINATIQKFNQVTAWGAQHNVPVILSEFGYMKDCEYNSRMCAYATVVDQALAHNVAFSAWEDGGDFKFYNRAERTWHEIKDILMHTYKESPYKMKIGAYADTLIKIQWKNRTTENDSIMVERKVDNGNFTFFAKIAPRDSVFIDTTASTGRTYYYHLRANLKDSIEIQSYPIRLVNLIVVRVPYTGTAIAIPGTVEAENFDKGMEGLTYHDADFLNLGEKYRLGEGVDIYQIGGTYYVGNVVPDEWLEYSINVQQEGSYNISANMAAITAGGEFNLEFNNGTTLPFTAEVTGSLSTFKKISNTYHVLAGQQTVRLNITKIPEFSINNITFSGPTLVEEEKNVPTNFELSDIYPNPFNPSTTIAFSLPSKYFVTLKIFDVIGREVATIVSEELEAGEYTRQWNAHGLSSGVYYYRIQAGNFTDTRKLVLLK